MPKEAAPKVPKGGAIPADVDEIGYDEAGKALVLGTGRVEGVTRAMWEYEVSGKQVLTQWFSYRKKNRERPIIGDRRPPSKLGEIQPGGWLAEYTTELINVLNVIGRLIAIEPRQAKLLERICAGKLIDVSDVSAAVARRAKVKKTAVTSGPTLFAE